MECLADCGISFSHPIVVNLIFCAGEIPIEIGHLIRGLKKVFFVRPCMGVLQTGEIFCMEGLHSLVAVKVLYVW